MITIFQILLLQYIGTIVDTCNDYTVLECQEECTAYNSSGVLYADVNCPWMTSCNCTSAPSGGGSGGGDGDGEEDSKSLAGMIIIQIKPENEISA